MDNLNLFIPIKKVDSVNQLVYGTLAAEIADQSGEIMDYDTAKAAFQKWSDEFAQKTEGKSKGNVRAMHGNVAAGKLTSISFDDAKKEIYGCAHIVDENEWKKCAEGVYTGFSLGGKYAKRWPDPGNSNLKRYTPTIAEVSVVDNPCIPSATFEFIKADGAMELRKFQVVEEAEKDAAAGVEQVWLAKDGSTHKKKADAVQKNMDMAKSAVPDAVQKAMDALKSVQDALAAKEGTDEQQSDAVKAVEAEPAKTEDGKIVTEADARKAVIAAGADAVAKGLCDVANLIDVINAMQWLTSDLNWNALFTENQSTLPQDCKAVLAQLCELLTAMVAEATAAITSDKAAGLTAGHVESLRKFSGNPEFLKDWQPAEPKKDEQAQDTATKLAAEHTEALTKVAEAHAEELKKVTDALDTEKAARATVEKALTEVTAGVSEMAKRIEKLEAQPMPAKGVKNATVIKGHEGQAAGASESPGEVLKYAHLSPADARARMQADRVKAQ